LVVEKVQKSWLVGSEILGGPAETPAIEAVAIAFASPRYNCVERDAAGWHTCEFFAAMS
jgi:hypothetical protein